MRCILQCHSLHRAHIFVPFFNHVHSEWPHRLICVLVTTLEKTKVYTLRAPVLGSPIHAKKVAAAAAAQTVT